MWSFLYICRSKSICFKIWRRFQRGLFCSGLSWWPKPWSKRRRGQSWICHAASIGWMLGSQDLRIVRHFAAAERLIEVNEAGLIGFDGLMAWFKPIVSKASDDPGVWSIPGRDRSLWRATKLHTTGFRDGRGTSFCGKLYICMKSPA